MISNFLKKNYKSKKTDILLSKILDRNNISNEINDINHLEYSVYSQWGDDGIISFLINKLNLTQKPFIEFGVEDYTECNSRLSLEKFNMSGLVIECDKKNFKKINQSELKWKYDLKIANEFITLKNINQIIKSANLGPDLAYLSIDVDGNDYWIWESLDQSIKPDFVVIEFNSIFGQKLDISTIYRENFNRKSEHFSCLLYGASIQALIRLAKSKGYFFLGTNLNGNNSYFVSEQYSQDLKNFNPKINFSKFKESRDQNNKLSFFEKEKALNLLKNEEVFNFKTNKTSKLGLLMNEG